MTKGDKKKWEEFVKLLGHSDLGYFLNHFLKDNKEYYKDYIEILVKEKLKRI